MNGLGKETFSVHFVPANVTVECSRGALLLEVARRSGVPIASDCGGRGRCCHCAVRIEGAVEDAVPQTGFSPQDLAAGWRRACTLHVAGACTVHVPRRSALLPAAGQNDGPSRIGIRQPVLRADTVPGMYRRGDAWVGPIAGRRVLGLAVDLGTTNIAAAALDMQTGEVVAAAAVTNPQLLYGADVITRLNRTVHDRAIALTMQAAVVDALAQLAFKLSGQAPQTIAEVAVVGNSVMQHLLLGWPLETLTEAPYRPHTLEETNRPTAALGLSLAPGAWLHVGPDVAAFIGSDHVSALLEVLSRGEVPREPWALVDIGTNTEISLFRNGHATCVSCASGPAFEGGMLTCGMRAAPGAITRVVLGAARPRWVTVDEAEPVGLCGSGVVSLLAQLLRRGAIDSRGRLQAGFAGVRERNGQREFLLHDSGEQALPVVLTQSDIRHVQLAKSAIRSGLELLLAAASLTADDLSGILLAGAFGKFLAIDDAVAIGLLPDSARQRIVQVGNAAGAGVRRLLVDAAARAQASQLARAARFLELTLDPKFNLTFARYALFPVLP